MSKHTPGPWLIVNDKSNRVHIEDVGGSGVAILNAGKNRAMNARLIAAAPDLLEAVKKARDSLVAFKFMPGPSNAWEEHDEANLIVIDAAIAKAAGDQQ